MSMQNFEQVHPSEEKHLIVHNRAFFGQRGRGRNMCGGRVNFRGYGSHSIQNRRNDTNQASNSTALPSIKIIGEDHQDKKKRTLSNM